MADVGETPEALRAEVLALRQRVAALERDAGGSPGAPVPDYHLLRVLMDSVPDGIYFKDAAHRFLRVNRAVAARFGLSDPLEASGRSDADFFSSEFADETRGDEAEVMRTGRPLVGKEEKEVWPDGHESWASTTTLPLTAPDGRIVGVVGISRDITARKHLEEQLRQAQKMEAVGQLAGGIAHDFNNLLTAILGNVSLLAQTPLAGDSRDLLQATEHAALRAAELTSQLLGFSRQTQLRLQPADLNHVMHGTVAILRRIIDPRIVVEVHPDADLWTIEADSGQLNQVLMNLCINARDAMPDGGRLCLQTTNVALDAGSPLQHLEARPGEFVRLRVSDSGHGIPPEVRPRIFDPFFTTKEPGKGTGLGLAMVFGIVKQHHGWVEFASEVGRGTDFDIYLPRAAVEAPAVGAPPAEVVPGGGSETILLVDDEAIIRSVGSTILQRYGYRVLVAEDGADALDVYRRHGPEIDLVVLDMTMPRLSGRDTLRHLCHIDPDVRVLFSSGYAADLASGPGKEAIVGFVSKPYRPQDLATTVRLVLDRHKTVAAS